jgi:thiamine-phosphate pyrophosphorylase
MVCVDPNDYIPTLSRSCHSIEELTDGQRYDYLFLSPIFDSISKKGYRSAFSPEQLTKAGKEGVINEKVIALGGITPEKKTAIKDWNFGGIAVLGFLWQEPTIAGVIRQLTRLRND